MERENLNSLSIIFKMLKEDAASNNVDIETITEWGRDYFVYYSDAKEFLETEDPYLEGALKIIKETGIVPDNIVELANMVLYQMLIELIDRQK